MISLAELLELVGELDDRPGDSTSRHRFRTYLERSVTATGPLRDYVEECLRTKGPQQCRALQDLVNHAARLIGFEVEFGRYQGVINAVGFDGLWRHPKLNVVAEIKTTDAFAIKTSILINYINELVSEKKLSADDRVLGLYVVARPDSESNQLENSIVAEKRNMLRIATVESIISLADLVQQELLAIDEVIELLAPTKPSIDETVKLLTRVAGQEVAAPAAEPSLPQAALFRTAVSEELRAEAPLFLLAPVGDDEHQYATECIDRLLGIGEWAFSDRTPGRKRIKPGDYICFYAQGVGVVAKAKVASLPEERTHPLVKHPERYKWMFRLSEIEKFLDSPVVIDSKLRSQLEYFKDRNPEAPWAWFVQTTRPISEHDFELLTGRKI